MNADLALEIKLYVDLFRFTSYAAQLKSSNRTEANRGAIESADRIYNQISKGDITSDFVECALNDAKIIKTAIPEFATLLEDSSLGPAVNKRFRYLQEYLKQDVKSRGETAAFRYFLAHGSLPATLLEPTKDKFVEDFADYLRKNNIVMYGAWWCPACDGVIGLLGNNATFMKHVYIDTTAELNNLPLSPLILPMWAKVKESGEIEEISPEAIINELKKRI